MFDPRATGFILTEFSPSFQISWTLCDVFWTNDKIIQQLSTRFTCQDGKRTSSVTRPQNVIGTNWSGEYSVIKGIAQPIKYSIWKHFVQPWNYTNKQLWYFVKKFTSNLWENKKLRCGLLSPHCRLCLIIFYISKHAQWNM